MKVLFRHLPYEAPIRSFYCPPLIGLAEGLNEKRIEFFGNCNYWFDIEKNEFLLKEAPGNYEPDIEVHTISYFLESYRTFNFNKRIYYILIESSDGDDEAFNLNEINKYALILKCHYLDIKRYTRKVVPWMFGLTNRMLDVNQKFNSEKQNRNIFINHRLSHGLRELMTNPVEKYLAASFNIDYHITDSLEEQNFKEYPHYWAQTGRRHNEQYYKRLNQSMLSFCFGGNFNTRFLSAYTHKFVSLGNNLPVLTSLIKKNLYIYQFDSFRFWESLASNSVPLHMDFERWGMVFPVQPKSGIHYIGVEALNFKKSAALINEYDDTYLKKVGQEGKKWVIENYNPERQAEYFLSYLK